MPRAVALVAPVALVSGLALLPGPVGAQPAAGPSPVFTTDHTSAEVGQLIRLQGVGFGVPGGVVSISICGNNAINESADCNLAASTQAAVRDGGTFAAGITVAPPPTPCPCVVRVTGEGGALNSTVPLAIAGVAEAPLRPENQISRTVQISNVGIEGSGPASSWFGAPPERSIVFSVTNTSPVTLRNPRTLVTWGRGDDPDGFIPPPDLGELAPGQTTTVRATVPLPALSVGTYRVKVTVDPIGGTPATATAETTIIPWGWIAVGLVLLQMVLLRFRNSYRRRLARRRAQALAGGGGARLAGGEGEPATADVVEVGR